MTISKFSHLKSWTTNVHDCNSKSKLYGKGVKARDFTEQARHNSVEHMSHTHPKTHKLQ